MLPNSRLLTALSWACVILFIPVIQAAEHKDEFSAKSLPQPQWNLFTAAHEVQLGVELAAEIEGRVEWIRNKGISSYIERVGRRVTGSAHASWFKPSVKILADESLYSVGLPSGRIYLTTGLARLAGSESELAALIAHEAAHTLLRQVSSGISRAARIRVRVALESASRGDLPLLKALEVIGIDAGVNSEVFRYGPRDEHAALDLAANLLAKSGYDRSSMNTVLKSLLDAAEDRSGTVLSLHPITANWVAQTASLSAREPPSAEIRSFGRFRGKLKKKVGTQDRSLVEMLHGETKKPEEPPRSGPKEVFLTRGYQFAYPSTWVPSQPGPAEAFQVSPKGGILKPAGKKAKMTLGMLSGMLPLPPSQGFRAAAVPGYLESLRPGLTIARDQSRLPREREGLAVLALEGDSPLPGQKERVWIATTTLDDKFFYLMMIAPEKEFEAVERIFREAYESIEIRQRS